MRSRFILLLVFLMAGLASLFLFLSAATGDAAPGDLDTSFGGGGWVSTPFTTSGKDYAQSLIQQADGKLVVAGYSRYGSGGDNDVALVRYNGDGTLDMTFNATGKLITSIGVSNDEANSVIQQADGKLVVTGYSSNGSNNDIALIRYNSDGTLDTTFNGTGKRITSIGASNDEANSVIQQADGKLVAAGYSRNDSGTSNFVLVRYNSDGTLDKTFNDTGKLTTVIGALGSVANSVIQQADGKLVAAGYSYISGSGIDFALVRYTRDGTLDTTFNGTGKLTTDIGTSTDRAYSVIQQADGKLVVAGDYGGYNRNGTGGFALVRYNSNGTLDATFNGTGKLITSIGASGGAAHSVIQQADGKLVAAGHSLNGSNWDFALVRVNRNGTLDARFNDTGKVSTAIGASDNLVSSAILPADDLAYSVIQQADGKLVAAGYFIGMPMGQKFVVARFESGQRLMKLAALVAPHRTAILITTALVVLLIIVLLFQQKAMRKAVV